MKMQDVTVGQTIYSRSEYGTRSIVSVEVVKKGRKYITVAWPSGRRESTSPHFWAASEAALLAQEAQASLRQRVCNAAHGFGWHEELTDEEIEAFAAALRRIGKLR